MYTRFKEDAPGLNFLLFGKYNLLKLWISIMSALCRQEICHDANWQFFDV